MRDVLPLQKADAPAGWSSGQLYDFIELQRGHDITKAQAAEGDVPVISSSGISYWHDKAISGGPGVVTGRKGSVGPVFFVERDFWPHDTTLWVADFRGNLPEYVWRFLQACRLERFDEASSVPTLNRNNIHCRHCVFPPLSEQRKIAEILRTWDEALEKLTALRTAKVRRISSLRQRLFEAEYASHNRLQRAKDLFETVSERGRTDLPLLAVMQDIGIVRRDELDRRVAMPDGDTSNYKVVRPGDFVISLRSFEGGLEYSSIIGLVSPAYTVLRPTTDLIGDYYRHFFKSRSFIGRLDKLIFGIRDGKQIAFRDFGDMYIPAPPVAEQEAQARALGSLETDLALEDERIATLARQKRGLIQKLLTGEWRVNSEKELA